MIPTEELRRMLEVAEDQTVIALVTELLQHRDDAPRLKRAIADLRAGLFDVGLMAEREEQTDIAQRVTQVLANPYTLPRCMDAPPPPDGSDAEEGR